MNVERTTFDVEGIQEPCIIVSSDDGYVQVRISIMHYLIGRNTLYLRETHDGEYQSSEEYSMPDFCEELNDITDEKAKELAQELSVYL